MTHQYELLEQKNLQELNRIVTEHLAAGWDLWGNPFVVVAEYGGVSIHYFQALTQFDYGTGRKVIYQEEHTLTDKPAAGYSVQVPETPGPPQGQDFNELGQAIASAVGMDQRIGSHT